MKNRESNRVLWSLTMFGLLGFTAQANFNFNECSGSGTFEQQIHKYTSYDDDALVGEIPADIEGLEISLKSNEDVDIRLYGENDDKIVHWPYGTHNQPIQQTKPYKNVPVTYSGYNGVDGDKGNEFIKVEGTTPTAMTMKAFGYKAGYATVNYSWTGKTGCTPQTSGNGSFIQTLEYDASSLVGTIPPGVNNVEIKLTSDKDLDIQLFAQDGTAIASWKPAGLMAGSAVQSIEYEGMDITWSGYNGVGGHKGHEYIKITGETSQMLVMKVYGYEAGVADVTYKWGEAEEIPTLSNIHEVNVTKNSVKIFWDVSKYSTGQVEYGETTAYGSFNKKETSFKYNHHEQLLPNLKQGTLYHYRVISEDPEGNRVVSGDYHFRTLDDTLAVIPYIPNALPLDMIQNEAMNMNPNHPKFDHWTNPENIVNGELHLLGQYDNSSYYVPKDSWLPHHKYTVVWDMETTGNVNEDRFPKARFYFLGDYIQGQQNSVLNKKETLYTVIVSEDDLLNNSNKDFQFSRRDKITNSTIKISNVRIYDGVIEIEKPVLKETNFQGSMTMDKEGVFRRNGKVIFPITIYKDGNLIDTGKRSAEQYIAQGITGTLMEAHYEHWVPNDSVSKMIESGMTTMSIPITNYLKNPDYAIDSYYFNDFSTIMQTFKDDDELWNSIATLTIDNEFYHRNQQFRNSIQEIRNTIPDKPIQMLNGTEAISAWYNDYIDITGTYIANDNEVKADHHEARTNIHVMESQRLSPNLHIPVTLLQMNQGTDENFGAILMSGVALGGTKLEYWKDSDELFEGFRNLNIPELPMWNQLPTLRIYLNKMCDLGIIETTPYIGFKVTQTNDRYEYIKARLGKNNKAYIIASNMTSIENPSTVVFNQDYKGLHYTPSGKLKDIMTGVVKGSINPVTKKVKITLAPHTWVVLEIEKQ